MPRQHLPLVIASLLIGLATLLPTVAPEAKSWTACLLCGELGLADAIANVVLYLPAGIALSISLGRNGRSLIIASLVSAGIELLQTQVPGRDPNPADVLFNSLGAALGILVASTSRTWLHPPPRLARRWSALATLLAVMVFLAPGVLLSPSLPRSLYYGQWAADLGQFDRYEGRVLSATIGPVPVPAGEMQDPGRVRSLLLKGAPLQVRASAGPAPPGPAPIVSVFDDRQREIFLLGADGHDLIWRLRTRAAALKLHQPEIRIRSALGAFGAGDTLLITFRGRPEGGYCLVVNGLESCGLGYSSGDGWAMLAGTPALSTAVRQLLGAAWIAVWMIPVGFWSRNRLMMAATVTVGLLSLRLLPALVGLVPTELSGYLAASMGSLTGMVLRRIVGSRGREGPPRAARTLVLSQPKPKFSRSLRYWD